MSRWSVLISLVLGALLIVACSPKPPPSAPALSHSHKHVAPHGGTAVVLGEELYHLELVRAPESGKLTAYLLDGEMENFVRSGDTAFTIDARFDGTAEPLVFKATANPATGETLGDTAQFEAQADWLKHVANFDGTVRKLTLHGHVFEDVAFNFPRGNEPE
jgi:hypothetical protein